MPKRDEFGREPCPHCGGPVDPHRPYVGLNRKEGVPSVTGAIDVLDDNRSHTFGFAASGIAAHLAVHEAERWIDLGTERCDHSTKHFCPACRYIRSEFDRVWTAKMHLGTHVHHLISSRARGEAAEADYDSEPYVDGSYERFVWDCEPHWIWMEQTVLYGAEKTRNTHRYRGTFDAIADLTVNGERSRWLFDWKSTSGVYPAAMTLQLAAYRHAQWLTTWQDGEEQLLERMPTVDHAGVVWLRADGEYRLIELPADGDAFGHFLRTIDTWRYMRDMERWRRDNKQVWEGELEEMGSQQ